ncbi:hypothetical protein M2284_003597 [Rhodococcus sp. LBL1]|nr:hypothetical protein [Rhodococcus sp. LBL1]MDH6685484.1 hypothetical protein [Rhodococcus sp. LBL2]
MQLHGKGIHDAAEGRLGRARLDLDRPRPARFRGRMGREWDDNIDELEPSDGYKVERRAVLVSTFERTIALAVAREQGRRA